MLAKSNIPRLFRQFLSELLVGSALVHSATGQNPGAIVQDEASLRSAMQAGGVIQCSGYIPLSSELVASKPVVLKGDANLSGERKTRILRVLQGVPVEIDGLRFVSGVAERGGAILNEGGDLRLTRCTFSSNVAMGASGTNGSHVRVERMPLSNNGCFPFPDGCSGGDGGQAQGGAIWASGSLSLVNCFFFQNSATGGAGGMGGTFLTSTTDTRYHGRLGNGGNSSGGHIYFASGKLSMQRAGFLNGGARGGNGGAFSTVDRAEYVDTVAGCVGGLGGHAKGGTLAISEGLFELRFASVSTNFASGGDIMARLILPEPGPGLIPAGGSGLGGSLWVGSRSIGIAADISLYTAIASGGANLSDNHKTGDASGGAIYNHGDLALERSAIGWSWADGRTGTGGAIHNEGTLVMTNVTLSENRARGDNSFGGAMHVPRGQATAVHCTFWGNYAERLPPGGSESDASGIKVHPGASFAMANSILADNIQNNGSGSIMDLGHNLSSDSSIVWSRSTSRSGLDPMIQPIGFDPNFRRPGIPYLRGDYLQLQPGSPAIDAGDPVHAPPIDQWGLLRNDGKPDIGASEDIRGRVGMLVRRPGDEARFFWDTSPAARLQFTTNLSTPKWQDVEPDKLASLMQADTNLPARFLRVVR